MISIYLLSGIIGADTGTLPPPGGDKAAGPFGIS
jgi:hypothetical protein